ncbi:hypothetical protein ACHWQZ_G016576 [Mnemiopsis leidyi]
MRVTLILFSCLLPLVSSLACQECTTSIPSVKGCLEEGDCGACSNATDQSTYCTKGDSCITLIYTNEKETKIIKTCGKSQTNPFSYCDSLSTHHSKLGICNTWLCYYPLCNGASNPVYSNYLYLSILPMLLLVPTL